MCKKEVLACLYLSILILFSANCFNNDNYPNINTHKSFNPDSLLRSENSVELIIESEFDYYLLNQVIWIKAAVINNTNSNFYSRSYLQPIDLNIVIIDPFGNGISKKIHSRSIMLDTVFVVKPGERYQRIIPLEIYMGFDDYKIGKYQISCILSGYCNPPKLTSNTIEIEVIEPKGKDKELYDLTYGLRLFPISYDGKLKLHKLLNQFNESIYAPQLYNVLIITTFYQNSELFEISCNEYFNRYMENFESIFILTSYTSHLKHNSGLSNYEIDQRIFDLANRNKTEKSKIIFDSFFNTTYKEIKERNYEDN